MAFSFGFSGDDIEEDPDDMVVDTPQEPLQSSGDAPPPIPARSHDLDELVGMRPRFCCHQHYDDPNPSGCVVNVSISMQRTKPKYED